MSREIGDCLLEWKLDHVPAAGMSLWSDILNDPNPIHLSSEDIKACPTLPAINPGPANLAYIMNMLQHNFPGYLIEKIETQLRGNVVAGDQVRVTGKILNIFPEGVECSADLCRGSGEVAVTAVAVLRKPPKETAR